MQIGFRNLLKVPAARLLIDLQAKDRQDSENVIEYVRLDRLVIGPRLVAAENVNLDRESVSCRRQLPYEKSHVFVDFWMAL